MKRAAIHLGLIGGFLFAIALSAAPQLHERIHPDAKQAQHECAITIIAAGNYHHTTPVIVVAAAPAFEISDSATLKPIWVASPFLSASIFEHAPPALA
jgi:hypothetical protein